MRLEMANLPRKRRDRYKRKFKLTAQTWGVVLSCYDRCSAAAAAVYQARRGSHAAAGLVSRSYTHTCSDTHTCAHTRSDTFVHTHTLVNRLEEQLF